MPTPWLVLFGALLLLLLLGGLEFAGLVVARRRIRIRIHVNGTRGKSSVTRLIAAGLRAELPTFAKTTGTLPRLIYPDGSELPVFRPARANIIEQVKTVRLAAATGAEALVLECMALQPLLQSLSELRIIRSTHSVITNARPDHLDVMGPTPRHVAEALCGTVSVNGRVFTADEHHTHIFEQACNDRNSQLTCITREDVAQIRAEDLAKFSYNEHAENVALALAVCEAAGVDRDRALESMFQTTPDPGALTLHVLDFFGRTIRFYNGFAANDPVSTERLWNLALDQSPTDYQKIAVFNCRIDRGDRSTQLAKVLMNWKTPDWVVLMGTGTHVFARAATQAGFDAARLVFVEGLRVDEIFERLLDLTPRRAMIMGMGNIGGQGLDLVRLFRNREVLAPEPPPPQGRELPEGTEKEA